MTVMLPEEREAMLHQMSRACRENLSQADALFVALTMMEQTARMTALLNLHTGQLLTEAQFAAMCLRYAKRVQAGGPV